jgi:hypothetical protein
MCDWAHGALAIRTPRRIAGPQFESWQLSQLLTESTEYSTPKSEATDELTVRNDQVMLRVGAATNRTPLPLRFESQRSNAMNVALVTLLAKPRLKRHETNYFVGFHHLVESLRRHSGTLPPVVVLSPDLQRPPPGADRLEKIRSADYAGIQSIQKAFGKSVYFKLDLFRLPLDRVVYIDTDVLAFQDVSTLWSPDHFNDHAIYGVRESASLGLTNPAWQGRLNTGVMVINRPLLSAATFRSMLNLATQGNSYDLGDQGVVNAFLTAKDDPRLAGELPARFNMPSCVRTSGDWPRYADDIAMMHYLGPRKPWMNHPEHPWHHPETQAMWDQETAHHAPVPHLRESLASSFRTRLVRAVQRYEEWRRLKPEY